MESPLRAWKLAPRGPVCHEGGRGWHKPQPLKGLLPAFQGPSLTISNIRKGVSLSEHLGFFDGIFCLIKNVEFDSLHVYNQSVSWQVTSYTLDHKRKLSGIRCLLKRARMPPLRVQ